MSMAEAVHQIRPALTQPRSRVFDAARWTGYRPRPDDIIIGTYSKCGTTWTQHIVGMLVFGSSEPRSVFASSPWPDFRFALPEGAVWPIAEAQTHRRFFKTHLPLDALPLYEDVKYVHVARDGRDAAMSLHNHLANFSAAALARADEISLGDPKYRDPFPRADANPRDFFRRWVADDAGEDKAVTFFPVEQSYWAERERANVLLVHYNDLKKDRGAEMRRIAAFLEIEISEALWPSLIEAASFEAMKRNGDQLLDFAAALFEGGADRFLHKGTNGRWQDVVAPSDLAIYEARVKAELPPALARWLEHGRLVAGDPRTS
jgi:aryl sulfotransferase